MSGKLSYCFTFVCQQGELEIKALLLAASLRHSLRCKYELVAAIPGPPEEWGEISIHTISLLKELDVKTVTVHNPFGTSYPIANKIPCLDVDTEADRLIFLDSDILCLREFYPDECFLSPFNAKPADLVTCSTDLELWRKIYEICNLSLPESRVFSTVSGEMMPPYFNAGLVAIEGNRNFSKIWMECCLKIASYPQLPIRRQHLDQLSLPVALHKCGLPFNCLNESYNYPAHIKPLFNERLPILCHYHSPNVISREPVLKRLVKNLANVHQAIGRLMMEHPDWKILLENKDRKVRTHVLFRWKGWKYHLESSDVSAPDLIITGIPRSGTSYLCYQMHKVKNCVVVNEPSQIFAILAQQRVPWGIPIFHRELRRDILAGIPIENKVHKGYVTEDTTVAGDYTTYIPRISRSDFLLCTKNTLAYLARLAQLRYVMPGTHFIACVRNPYDTIASWKTSFSHLLNAKVEEFPIGSVDDPQITIQQRQSLQEIMATQNLAYRRALLWRYLAGLILENSEWMTVILYEDLVSNPVKAIRNILWHSSAPISLRFESRIGASHVRQKRHVLDEEDRQAIRAVCNQYAAEFGMKANSI